MTKGWLIEAREETNEALRAFLLCHLPQPQKTSAEFRLQQAVIHGIEGSGKRLRPILAITAFETANPEYKRLDREKALSAVLAVEFLHCSSLIHDDLPAMDNDELRRGRPTVWKAFDEATAILAGNVLNFLAFEALTEYVPLAQLPKAVTLLAKAAGIAGLNGGQMRDLFHNAKPDIEHIKETHRKKTGALIRSSAELGAIIGNADNKTVDLFREYADALGLAFQIKDDLLDAKGDEKQVGKKLQKDILSKGFVHFFGMDEAEAALEATFTKAKDIAKKLQNHKLGDLADFIVQRDC